MMKRRITPLFLFVFLLLFSIATNQVWATSKEEMYKIASNLGENCVNLANITESLDNIIKLTQDKTQKGLIYIASKEIEIASGLMVLEGELIGVSQYVKDDYKIDYYQHLGKVLQQSNAILEKNLKVLADSRVAMSDRNAASLIIDAENVIQSSVLIINKGILILKDQGR